MWYAAQTVFAPALPAQLFLFQHFRFLLQCCWCIAWPCWWLLRCRTCHPKLSHWRRAWCLRGARLLWLNFAQVLDQADVSPQYAKKLVKNVFTYFSPLGFAHASHSNLEGVPCCALQPRTQLLCPPLFWSNASSKCFKVNVDFHKSRKFSNRWRPQSLLSWTDS